MSLSLYDASVPVFRQILTALSAVLGKAEAWAGEHKVDQQALLQARLYPDMFPMVRQVQVAADFAKGCGSRLAGVEPPPFPDTEKSFAELQDRLARTVKHLETLDRGAIDASADRTITLPVAGQPMSFQGQPYLLNFALPNFYFHATTAYAILRHNGVPLGKRDFLGVSTSG